MDNSACSVSILRRENCIPYREFFSMNPNSLVQQSVEWADVISPLSPDEPFFVVAREKEDGRVLGGLPLYLFRSRPGSILTSVPHAGPLGGCIILPELSVDEKRKVYDRLLSAAKNLALELNCLAMTIITHPLLDDLDFYQYRHPADYILKNFCQIIDVASLGKMPDLFSHSIRKNIKIARKSGMSLGWGSQEDFDAWYAIHSRRHEDLGLQPLSRTLLDRAFQIMSQASKGGLLLARIGGEVIGGVLLIWDKIMADFFMMSSDSNHLSKGVNYLLTEEAIRIFKEKGIPWLNWQSCRRGSGVYEFKERWGSREHSYQFLTWTFAGFKSLFSLPAREVSENFRWHYIAPFEALEKKMKRGVFEKS